MSTITPIHKNPILGKGEDFVFLRDQGIDSIQAYSGLAWSDHNLHDPGITLLEAFCYVLTEISLKANLDIKDILASGEQNAAQVLFRPEEILPSRPVTLIDYRKSLIDTDGIRNAWLIPIPFWEVDDVKGLYDVLLELDEDEDHGDLNSGIIERSFDVNFGGGDIRTFQMEVSFPPWDEVIPFQEEVIINNITSPALPSIQLSPTTPNDQNDYLAELEITYDGASTTTFSVTIRITPPKGSLPAEIALIEAEIIALLSEAPGGMPADQSILTTYRRKVTAAAATREEVAQKLMTLRNLDEDIRNIKSVRIQEIGLNVRIDVLGSINIEKYLASLLYQLEIFFKPPIVFTSLEELEKDQVSYEQIFDGPLLSNGFLDNSLLSDLDGAIGDSRNSTIYVSDLLNLVMRVALEHAPTISAANEDQLIAISSISISNFIRNIAVVQKATDCLILAKPELYKPRFSLNKSNIRFYRNQIELAYNLELVDTLLVELREAEDNEIQGSNIPDTPSGDKLELGPFHSIQHDFPTTYGLGKNVLTDTYPAERRAKVEQFRAYLTLLDQLLASQCGLLVHINDLFSIDPQLNSTYFKDPLYQLPYLQRILMSFINSGMSWEAFQADVANDYQLKLDEIIESRQIFLDRRNRFLDHLMGRFQISIDQYRSAVYEEDALAVADSEELEFRQQELANDLIAYKINYLELWPELSLDRFAAYDYTDTPWDTTNTSGLEKRLITILGLRNLNRRTLFDEAADFIQIIPALPNFNYVILDKNATPMLEGVSDFPSQALAEEAARLCIRHGVDRDNFHIQPQPTVPVTYLVGVQPDPSELPTLLASSPTPHEEDKFEARIRIRNIIGELREVGSGLYVVEHILLRPQAPATFPLEIPKDETGLVSDPYSMRITIILPSGYERDFNAATDPEPIIPAQFQDEKFRSFAERQIRMETPSHILARVFWLDQNTVADLNDTPSLNNFTERWQSWLEAKADPTTLPAVLENRREELLTVINAIYQLP